MRRRNFIKIFAGALVGVATGVGLAKKKEDPLINGWEGVTIIDDSKPDQLTAADLSRAKKYCEKCGMSLKGARCVIIVHPDQYELCKKVVTENHIDIIVIKDILPDNRFITIPLLSKKARGFK